MISSRTSGASALIEHGRNGWLFDLEKPETFHQGLNQILGDPFLARDMAARGAKKVLDAYSVQATAKQMRKLYETLIQEKQCVTS